jgi:predicted RNA-binding protein with PIN domain
VRHRHLGRDVAGRRGGHLLTGATALLRPALEAAISVARDGERATPPTPAPNLLKRYLSFARLPDPALDVARRVLEDDDDFRSRVADAVDEDDVGRAAWVWLTRPDGWSDELRDLERRAAAAELTAREERTERDAQRRLAGAEAALARVEAALRASVADADDLRAGLHEERLAARALATEVERLRGQVDDLSADRALAIQRVKELEAKLAERGAEVKSLRHELRMVQAEMAAPERAGAPAAPSGSPSPSHSASPELSRILAEAAETAAALGVALSQARTVLRGGPRAPVQHAAAPADDAPPPQRRRLPARLPPGLRDDTPAAVEHLLRAPGAVVLLDGYNVSQNRWHGLPPSEQRSRLLDLCAELHARTGAEMEVVFDGAGDTGSAGALVRSEVRYRFTPAGVEADDLLLARVEELPVNRTVVVVSSDGRVREGARSRGANVVGARQFLTAVGR